MARANPEIILALRRTAEKLYSGANYQWGHMGSCNCGHLAQEVTRRSKKEIHASALRSRSGDWNEQLIDYCPGSGLPMDEVIAEILAAGFDSKDLQYLERLNDPDILQLLPKGQRYLRHNKREDVVLYLQLWAKALEDQWLEKQKYTGVASALGETRVRQQLEAYPAS
ncbi:hypothetical protein [Nafulsella turpanensis]|uniref:hypothetical protein n=1 Tax=Nafulsella turpanensis TaxID=1265690 RepID=UPI00034A17D4|nr:hypothetical protein [Nafulsella turpanensis]